MTRRQKVFLWMFWISFGLWFVGVFFSTTQQNLFYVRGHDLFADFFNNVRYVANRDPYFDATIGPEEHIYPPICYLLFYPFSRLLQWIGTLRLPEDGLTVFWHNPVAMLSAIVFTAFALLLFAWAIWRIIRPMSSLQAKVLLMGSFFASGVVLFSFERGNLILLTAALLASFLAVGNEALSDACLSLAIATKIYPVVFISLLLRKREFGRILKIGFTVVILGFAPLIFFKHGFAENSFRLFNNVRLHESIYFYSCPPNLSLASYMASMLHIMGTTKIAWCIPVVRVSIFALGLVAFSGIWFQDEEWKRWFLAAATVVFCSRVALYYTLLYFLPAIFKYLSSEAEFKKVDWLYVSAAFLLLTPLQFGSVSFIPGPLNPFLVACVIVAIVLLIGFETVKRILFLQHHFESGANNLTEV